MWVQIKQTHGLSYLDIRYGLPCSKQVTMALLKEECGFLLSLPQTAILYPICLSQRMTSQNLVLFRSNFQLVGIPSNRSEQPMGQLHILLLRLMTPSVTCLGLTGAIGTFMLWPNRLNQFHRKHPKPSRESAAKQREIRERAREVPALDCKTSSAHCGYEGDVEYHHPPRTTYQLAARIKDTQDLQHFTKCLLPKKVERCVHISKLPSRTSIQISAVRPSVVSIPLAANADYRCKYRSCCRQVAFVHALQYSFAARPARVAIFQPSVVSCTEELSPRYSIIHIPSFYLC